ncbi:MAG: DUF5067 domain-containing protein [Ruminococcaceae bacterium]|nr:DUF5067 domain-containing protein [Oscillospiraceae bacterium]
MKKILCLLLAGFMLMTLAGCGATKTTNTGDTAQTEQMAAEQADPEILDTEKGTLRCLGVEKANSALSKESNVYLVKFEFTNKQKNPAECQDLFEINCFQNKVEVDELSNYYSDGGEHYELLGNYFKEAMTDGTITFLRGFILPDSTEITVSMKDKKNSELTTTVTLNLESNADRIETADSVGISVEQVVADLQGTWVYGNNPNSFVFEGDILTVGGRMKSTYTINTETSEIEATFDASDGEVSIAIPYKYENGELQVFNNSGEQLTKE